MRKFRKKHKNLLVIWNVGLIWYLLMFTATNFSSLSTNAIFIDQVKNESSFQAKTWWDKSSLTFINKYGGTCTEIFTYIKNVGDGDMALTSKYYVYYSPTGNPVNPDGINGELVFSQGVIPKMKSNGDPLKLTYAPQKPGFFKFVAFQHPDKPGENGNNLTIEGKPVTFSELIKVEKCSKP
ncbi:YqxM protein [Neobacillus niacini]|uniref:amyloid fiber anchoring/assembly protein TapA n=1 Tax=Neobacillus niacini TaxID=86668 RepID=UPI00277F504B|nr:amyloid fiber anchoring/assembly protein TapA [Neobacillus niacini]MDQ1001880.1 YqxM protein [Neobacillus niacini]